MHYIYCIALDDLGLKNPHSTMTCVSVRQPTQSTIHRNSEFQITYYTMSVRMLFTCVIFNAFPPYKKKKKVVSFSFPLMLFIFHPEQNKLQSPAKDKEAKDVPDCGRGVETR